MTTGELPGRPPRPALPLASVQGTLALDLTPVLDPPDCSDARRCGAARDLVQVDALARRRVEAWTQRYLQAAVEIAGGDRPASQLLRWSTAGVYDDLGRRAVLAARAEGRHPVAARHRRQTSRPFLVGTHTIFVGRDAVEVSAHVRYGERSRAVAARFEQQDEQWICVALEFA